MKEVREKRIWNFRGEQYEYVHTAWLCEDTNERFTTEESDTDAFVQVTNQYREKYGIPSKEEIVAIRKAYGVSAAKMSQILGIGINQYRLYEQGEVPSVSNGRMIRLIKTPGTMLELLECSKPIFSEPEYSKIRTKILSL